MRSRHCERPERGGSAGGPFPADLVRGVWCSTCGEARDVDLDTYDLGPCAHEALALDIPPAELALDREIDRAARRLVVLAGAQSLIERPEGR